MDINKHTLNISLFTYSVLCEFHAIIQLVWDSFWVIFIQQLYSKLSNSEITCPIDLKSSGKMHFHKKLRLKFGCKKTSML